MMGEKDVEPVNFLERTVEKHGEDIDNLKDEVGELKGQVKSHDQAIGQINKVLDAIQGDTRWLRRTITKAFITTLITGLIGGVIALFFTTI
jgi:peptidoglycan hydrolase CwlO-like protein